MNTTIRSGRPTGAQLESPGRMAKVAIWQDGKHFQTEMCWGLQPSNPDDRTISLLRAEGRTFERRCLIIANTFFLRPGTLPNRGRRKVEMIGDQRFFCFAGTWRAANATWPAAFAGITVEAYPDIEPFQDRHLAVVRRSDWRGWLSGEASEDEILRPFPIGSFRVSGPPPRPAARASQPAASGDLFG